MKSFKKIAVTVLAAVMMLLMSTTVFAANSPVTVAHPKTADYHE